jgi:hypothetical protein
MVKVELELLQTVAWAHMLQTDSLVLEVKALLMDTLTVLDKLDLQETMV